MRTFNLDEFWPVLSPAPAVGPHALARSTVPNAASGTPQVRSSDIFTQYEPPVLKAPEPDAPVVVFPATPAVMASALKSRDRRPYIWGGLGFFAGIFAWHILGFWTFLSNLATNPGPAPERVALAAPAARQPPVSATVHPATQLNQPAELQPSAQAIFNLDPKSCRALVLDRSAGATRLEACPDDTQPMRDAGRQRRGDLAANRARNLDPNAWAQGTAVDTAAVSESTLEPGDVNFEITEPKR